jgi:DNA-binding HxlR family transcriptional regulator
MPSARPSLHRSTGATATAGPTPAPWEEIDRCFRDFRESAVRLVERVHDLMAPYQQTQALTPKDVRTIRSVFGKWSMEVLVALHSAPSAGFEELRRSLPGVSPRVLSLKLKGLEQHGMVRREIVDARPPRVRYTLTDQGWTVAWLSDPVLLFLEQSGVREKVQGIPSSKPPQDSPTESSSEGPFSKAPE